MSNDLIRREILFRAKRIDNGEWVYGYYYESKISGCYILTPKVITRKRDGVIIKDSFDLYEIDPKTLCQFTGLKDKNGKQIWENDIIKHEISDTIGAVKWYEEDYVGWCVDDVVIDEQQLTVEMWSECDVIGNIFNNPELLNN